jgi:hypothetical protein
VVFILFTSDGPLNIRFSESALKEGSEEEKELRKNVKRVMEVRDEPDRKRVRIEGYRSKK